MLTGRVHQVHDEHDQAHAELQAVPDGPAHAFPVRFGPPRLRRARVRDVRPLAAAAAAAAAARPLPLERGEVARHERARVPGVAEVRVRDVERERARAQREREHQRHEGGDQELGVVRHARVRERAR